jgi:hypothetical protein
MKTDFILYFLAVAVYGCVKMSEKDIAVGVSEQQVKNVLGVPDYIEEQSGDQGRICKGNASPEYKWIDDAKIYYYMNTNKEYLFTKKRLIEIRNISEKKETLLDISKRNKY